MIKTPLSTVLGGAGIWTPGCTVIGGQQNLTQLIKSLFSNNEVGFAYDPNDLTTLYQDAAGTIPVTGAGQPVGLMLDKSKGLVLGSDVKGSGISGMVGTLSTPATYDQLTGVGTVSRVSYPIEQSYVEFNSLSPNALYKFEFKSIGGSLLNIRSGDYASIGTAIPATTTAFIRSSASGKITITSQANGTATFTILSIKELAGNHAYQTTSSMRPLLQNSPRKIDYDGVDDKLITNLPAQLIGCTVIRSVPNVGTQILTGQTIPATYEDNKDHCGLIVINRALTTAETAQITQLFNKAAGV